jgi:hypothetical protein
MNYLTNKSNYESKHNNMRSIGTNIVYNHKSNPRVVGNSISAMENSGQDKVSISNKSNNEGRLLSQPNISRSNAGWQDNIDLAYKKINSRREKLMQEKDLLNKIPVKPGKFANKNDISSLYTLNNLNQNREVIANRNYNYQMMEPIYYPLELPMQGEPVKLPNFDMGTVPTSCGRIHHPVHTKGISKEDQLALLMLILRKDDYEIDFDLPDIDFNNLKARKDVRSMDEYNLRVGTKM